MNPFKIIKYGKHFTNKRFMSFASHIGKNLTFLRQAVVLFLCFRDPETPKYVKAVIAGALGYLIIPMDMMPDAVAGLGWLDDLAVLAVAFKVANRYIKAIHHEKAKSWVPFGKDKDSL